MKRSPIERVARELGIDFDYLEWLIEQRVVPRPPEVFNTAFIEEAQEAIEEFEEDHPEWAEVFEEGYDLEEWND